MIVVAILGGVVAGWVMLLGLCRAASPHTDAERRYSDEAQMRAVAPVAQRTEQRSTEPRVAGSTPARGTDGCDPRGIPRPDVLTRAFGADDIASPDVQKRELAWLLRHPSAPRGGLS